MNSLSTMENVRADIIGDVHGHAEALYELLEKLGYRRAATGTWTHPAGRTAYFVGDLIDSGPDPRGVLAAVHAMTTAGTAVCVMGNHEFNSLVHYKTADSKTAITAMSERQLAAHDVTISRLVRPYPVEWQGWLKWMQQLPLWHDTGTFRVVHACWDAPSLAYLVRPWLDDALLRATGVSGADRQSVGTLLKGPLYRVSAREPSDDSVAVRIKWWEPIAADMRLASASVDPLPESVAGLPVPCHLAPRGYSPEAPMLFVGHYGIERDRSVTLAANIVCVDTGVSKGGPLSAWRVDEGCLLSV